MHLPLLVCLVMFCHVVCQGIIGIGGREKRLDGKEDCPDLKSGRPLVWNGGMRMSGLGQLSD